MLVEDVQVSYRYLVYKMIILEKGLAEIHDDVVVVLQGSDNKHQ